MTSIYELRSDEGIAPEPQATVQIGHYLSDLAIDALKQALASTVTHLSTRPVYQWTPRTPTYPTGSGINITHPIGGGINITQPLGASATTGYGASLSGGTLTTASYVRYHEAGKRNP